MGRVCEISESRLQAQRKNHIWYTFGAELLDDLWDSTHFLRLFIRDGGNILSLNSQCWETIYIKFGHELGLSLALPNAFHIFSFENTEL